MLRQLCTNNQCSLIDYRCESRMYYGASFILIWCFIMLVAPHKKNKSVNKYIYLPSL